MEAPFSFFRHYLLLGFNPRVIALLDIIENNCRQARYNSGYFSRNVLIRTHSCSYKLIFGIPFVLELFDYKSLIFRLHREKVISADIYIL